MHTTLRSTLRRLEREAERNRPRKILMLFRGADGVYRTLDGGPPIERAFVVHCVPGDEHL